MRTILLTDAAFDPAKLLTEMNKSASGAGAVASFTGLVRPASTEGEVTSLRLEAHPVLTLRGMNDAADAADKRWSLTDLTIVHRTGDIAVYDPIVFVAAASEHRRAALEAVDFLMDYLKTRAVFWKKETGPHVSRWIEPRTQDHSDFARWSSKEEA